jgi:hypothetical protein
MKDTMIYIKSSNLSDGVPAVRYFYVVFSKMIIEWLGGSFQAGLDPNNSSVEAIVVGH